MDELHVKAAEYIYKPGMAHVKTEFIIMMDQGIEINDKNETEVKVNSDKKSKTKGMNRKRSSNHNQNGNNGTKICPYVKSSVECPYKEKCRYEHSTDAALIENKKITIAGQCYNYSVRGSCPMGIMCLWSGSHVDANGVNMSDNDVVNLYTPVRNGLSKDLLTQLRKKKYDFDLTLECLDTLKINYNGRRDTGKNDVFDEVREKKLYDVRERNKPMDWNNKLYLAPLTTVGNLPFRRICKEYGADITCSEMAMASKLVQGIQSEWALLKRHPSEDIFGVQLCGSHPDVMSKCAQMMGETCDMDFIDVNVGCPIDLVCDKGEGCGLLRNKRRLENIVSGMSNVIGRLGIGCPITVKTRIGYSINEHTADQLLPRLRDVGAAMVALHGRTKEQRYTKQADWDYIGKCAAAASPMPVFGNGDILSYEDYVAHKDAHGVSGVMIGRGALIKPWLFTEIKEQRTWDISANERLDVLRRYVNYGLEYWGSDQRGVETTRKFLLEWMSFLHRYIPVGLLERPPQRINERPPKYFGRSDLETLMISDNCADWIKITEMMLGPVPDNFIFVPKHRANSYS